MNILLCGTCLPPQYETKIKDLSAAGNKYQINLFKNLKLLGNVKILSYINIDVANLHEDIMQDCKAFSIDCVFANGNLAQGIMEYRKKLKKHLEWADVILTYNVLYPWFGLGTLAKKKHKKSVAIIADFTPPEEYKSLSRKIYAFLMAKQFRKYQKVVMLSSGVSKYLSSHNELVTVNGCIDFEKFKDFTMTPEGSCYNLAYSGLLSTVTGVDLLIDAFKLIPNPDVRLYISGKGDLEQYVIEAAKQDRRIIYKGFLEEKEYYKMLNSAHVLINPRNMHLLQNQTNFPSKVLEYLAAGKTIVSTQFNGYEKYQENMYFIESEAEKLAECILDVIKNYSDIAERVYNINRTKAKTLTWENQIKLFI